MRTLAYPLSLLLVVAVPIALLVIGAGVVHWGRWLLGAGGPVGIGALVLCGAAGVNLLVPRSCEDAGGRRVVNRPLISAAVGDGQCFARGIGQLQVAVLTGVGASAAVTLRRSTRGGDGAAPGARSR